MPRNMSQGDSSSTEMVSRFEDKVVVMHFGYTSCPDVCPVTLSKLAEVREMLGDDADNVQVVMITDDPERDTTEVLENYMSHFDPTFIGLTGDPSDINRIASVYGATTNPRSQRPPWGASSATRPRWWWLTRAVSSNLSFPSI